MCGSWCFMQIKINEENYTFEENATVGTVRDQVKPDADLLIINGFPASEETLLNNGDQVVLIRRGEVPGADELDALLTARHTPGVHETVKGTTLGIAGVGGLGSAIAIALARTGIGHLIIADFDIVEPSNLNRQQFFIDQIGLPKVYALRDTLARINPHVRVTACHLRLTPGNIAEVFGHAQVLVEAFDQAQQKVMLIETFAARFPDRPIVSGSGMAGYGPANTILTQQVANNLYLCGDGRTAAAAGTGLMAPRVGVAAHHQANAVLRLLLGHNPATEDP
jgi:sulfur carrier protein ThiS adenylyltransferase